MSSLVNQSIYDRIAKALAANPQEKPGDTVLRVSGENAQVAAELIDIAKKLEQSGKRAAAKQIAAQVEALLISNQELQEVVGDL